MYDAAIIRAIDYAKRQGKILLWCVAEDRAVTAEHRSLSPEELDDKRRVWATYHDKKTAGVMGILPLVHNMPLVVTQADSKLKQYIFKNKRCRLYGWKLHEADMAQLQTCVAPEMKLLHLPEELYLIFPKDDVKSPRPGGYCRCAWCECAPDPTSLADKWDAAVHRVSCTR